jgi:hypothetical protein
MNGKGKKHHLRSKQQVKTELINIDIDMRTHLLQGGAQLFLLARVGVERLDVLGVGQQLPLVVGLSLLQKVRTHTHVALHLLHLLVRSCR